MKVENELTTFDNWTLRVRPGTGRQILLLLHGWTGDENSMSIFTGHFPEKYWIISPRAPYSANPKGYSWRAPASRGSWPTIDLLRPSVDALIELVDHWAASKNLYADSIDVAGFSQGGALTFTFGALYPKKVRKMGILAGFAPNGAADILTQEKLLGKNIFVAHGTLDEMVPFAMAMQTVKLLEEAGAKVHFCQSEAGHKLSSDCLKALVRYLED